MGWARGYARSNYDVLHAVSASRLQKQPCPGGSGVGPSDPAANLTILYL